MLYLSQEGGKKRGQTQQVCQSRKGNELHPSGRLGKYGTCRSGRDGLTTLGVGRATGKTAHYRGVSIIETITPPSWRVFCEYLSFLSDPFYSAWRGASEAGLMLAPSACCSCTDSGELTTGHCPLSTLSGAVPLKPR